jgi:hypothetical protein
MHYCQLKDDVLNDGGLDTWLDYPAVIRVIEDGVYDCSAPACGKLHGKWPCASHLDTRQAENDAMPDNMKDL